MQAHGDPGERRGATNNTAVYDGQIEIFVGQNPINGDRYLARPCSRSRTVHFNDVKCDYARFMRLRWRNTRNPWPATAQARNGCRREWQTQRKDNVISSRQTSACILHSVKFLLLFLPRPYFAMAREPFTTRFHAVYLRPSATYSLDAS